MPVKQASWHICMNAKRLRWPRALSVPGKTTTTMHAVVTTRFTARPTKYVPCGRKQLGLLKNESSCVHIESGTHVHAVPLTHVPPNPHRSQPGAVTQRNAMRRTHLWRVLRFSKAGSRRASTVALDRASAARKASAVTASNAQRRRPVNAQRHGDVWLHAGQRFTRRRGSPPPPARRGAARSTPLRQARAKSRPGACRARAQTQARGSTFGIPRIAQGPSRSNH